MLYVNLRYIVVVLFVFASLQKVRCELTIFSPVGASQGFVNISNTQGQANSLIAAASSKSSSGALDKIARAKNENGKQRVLSLSEIAENVKAQIEKYTKLRNLAQKQGSENRYDELLKDANDLAKEIEDASHKYDELRLAQTQKGNAESGAQADRLTEIIQSRTEPFNSLLWRMDQVIAEIKQGDMNMPDRTPHEGIPPTSKLVALTARTQPPEKGIEQKANLCDDEDEEDIKPKALQPFKVKDDELEDIGG